MPLQSDIDLLNPPAELEKSKHKLKRLVQSPNSFFMDVKCQGCFNMCVAARGAAREPAAVLFFFFFCAGCRAREGCADTPAPRDTCSTTVFSHSQTVVLCGSCNAVLCQPTGGRARLTEGCSFRRKGD